jgi:hypothetical protein
MCEECFEKAGRLFSDRGDTPRKARSERCIVCRRTARGRLLVAGAAAAICRRCYLAKEGKAVSMQFDWPNSRPEGTPVGDLNRARARRMRARREFQRLEKTIRSLKRPYVRVVRLKLVSKKVVAEFEMEPPLELVSLGKRAY